MGQILRNKGVPMALKNVFEIVKQDSNVDFFNAMNWEGTFEDYLKLIDDNPKITRTAFQRIYDMIMQFGFYEYDDAKKSLYRYKFFEDPFTDGKDAVFGLDVYLNKLVNFFKGASLRYGPEKRVLLLHGPVGSAKSTISRLLKKGVEWYSYQPEGALYTFRWINLKSRLNMEDEMPCPIHEEALHLVPEVSLSKVLAELNKDKSKQDKIVIEGCLCPACRYVFKELLKSYQGNWESVVRNHIKVHRLLLSEKDRVGIGSFQPKDEKNQDSTELTGDLNYRKIAEYGSDSDPRAFNFDGEFNVANRGLIEFVEMLKLDVAFLYDLLGASQEHKIKPKKFAQTDIDEVIIGHTNEPEYKKLQSNEFMEALRDRTVKIDVPYITKLKEEIRIYKKDFNAETVPHIHIAPHTIETAAMWAILTRLEAPKKANLTLMQKLKLYDGRTLPGFTENNIKELRKEAHREGLDGISPRYIQDKISHAIVENRGNGCLNSFILLNELESGLKHHALIKSDDMMKQYKELLSMAKQEFEDTIKNEVQRAISADEESIAKLCSNYIDNVKSYTQREKVRNKYTGMTEEPDERLMRSIEEKIDIPESRKDDFRREIMNYIGALALDGKTFDFRMNERLHKALELKLFEDQKDTIKLTSLVSSVVDKDSQVKIDIVKNRLIKNYGYCDTCATDVLHFVASIFARGDLKS